MLKRIIRSSLVAGLWTIAAASLSSSTNGQATSLKLSATYMIEQGTDRGLLLLQAEIPPGSHIYALTQKRTPPPTRIKIGASKWFEMAGKFAPNKKPTVVEWDPIFENRIEKHTGKIQFTAPLKITDATDVEKLQVRLKFTGQVCDDCGSCRPIRNQTVPVKFGGYYRPPKRDKPPKDTESGTSGEQSNDRKNRPE